MQRPGQTLTIQQVSQRLKVTKPTLRFWEKELEGVIVPLRTQGGQRRYSMDDLYIIAEVKRLKREGLRLVDIKERFVNGSSAKEGSLDSPRISLLADQIAQMVESMIYNFFKGESLD